MRIGPCAYVHRPSTPPAAPAAPAAPASPTTAAQSAPAPSSDATWTNPAAAAALHSGVDLLMSIEQGILRNFGDADRVRTFGADLRSTMGILDSAVQAIAADGSKENDAFLPLIDSAGGGVNQVQIRLSAKDFASAWPAERSEILASIRTARSISSNVANQLDPRSARS